jgi:hypothetical protein
MNHSARLLIVATLLFVLGCVKQDWIDRTLVTVDVTGTWSGYTGGGSGAVGSGVDFRLELEQHGSTVKGRFAGGWGNSGRLGDGPIEGTVAGDVFRFKETRGSGFEGELTVSGDEMTGVVSFWGQRRLSLRRTDPSSLPGSPPR